MVLSTCRALTCIINMNITTNYYCDKKLAHIRAFPRSMQFASQGGDILGEDVNVATESAVPTSIQCSIVTMGVSCLAFEP